MLDVQQHAALAGDVQALREEPAHLGPAQLRRTPTTSARSRYSSTRQLLRAVKGEVWLTEAGGIVRFGTRYRGGKRGEARAAKAVKHTFEVARSSSRIKRVYLYHWDADPKFLTWDSAFVAANGRARPALDVLRKELNRQRKGRAPAAAEAAEVPEEEAASLVETRTARRWRAVRELLEGGSG